MTKLTEANVNLNISDLNSSDMQALSQILSLAGQAEQAGDLMGGMGGMASVDPMGPGPVADPMADPLAPEQGLGEAGELAMAGPDADYGMEDSLDAADPMGAAAEFGEEDPMADAGLDLGLDDGMEDPMAGDDMGMDLGLDEPAPEEGGMDLDLGLDEPMPEEDPMSDDMFENYSDRLAKLCGLNESEEDDEEPLDEGCADDLDEDEEQLAEADESEDDEVIEEADDSEEEPLEEAIDEELDEAMVVMPVGQKPMGQDPAADMDWMRSADSMGGAELPMPAGDPNVPPQQPPFMNDADPSIEPQDPAFMNTGDQAVAPQKPAFMTGGDEMRSIMDSMFMEADDAEANEEQLDEAPEDEPPMGFEEFNEQCDKPIEEADESDEDEEQLDENAEGMYNMDLDEDAVAEMDSPGIGDNREFGPYPNEMACMTDARQEIPGAMRDREVKLAHKPKGWFWSKINEDATNSRPNITDVCTKGIENSRHKMDKSTSARQGDNNLFMESTVESIHDSLNEQLAKFMKGE